MNNQHLPEWYTPEHVAWLESHDRRQKMRSWLFGGFAILNAVAAIVIIILEHVRL